MVTGLLTLLAGRRRARRGRTALVGALLVLGLAEVATAEVRPAALPLHPVAQAHRDRGQRLYRGGHYDEALQEFRAGYDVDPRPEFLYALGQVMRAKGDCGRAAEYFTAFLRTAPPPDQAEKARVQLARCERWPIDHLPRSQPTPREAPPRSDDDTPGASRTRYARAHFGVSAFGDVLASRAGAEVAAAVAAGPGVDLGATAVLGANVGGRLTLGVHGERRPGWLPRPALELRGLVYPVADRVALGGGLWVGGTLELGPGRVRAGLAAELYSAPAGYKSFAVLAGGGFELDAWRPARMEQRATARRE